MDNMLSGRSRRATVPRVGDVTIWILGNDRGAHGEQLVEDVVDDNLADRNAGVISDGLNSLGAIACQ